MSTMCCPVVSDKVRNGSRTVKGTTVDSGHDRQQADNKLNSIPFATTEVQNQMSEQPYKASLHEIALDLKERWKNGAQPGDAYKLGFNAGLWNALCLISDVAEARGISLKEIGLDDLAELASAPPA